MLTLQERSKMANVFFVYLFEEVETKKVFYVGVTKFIGRRMNEHKRDRSVGRGKRTPLYVYMRDNDLELFKNVEVRLVGYTHDRVEASRMESEYIKKYADTVQNLVKTDTRKYSTDPRYRKVRCITTGETFHAVKPVCDKYKISRHHLVKFIERGEEIDGLKFEFIEV